MSDTTSFTWDKYRAIFDLLSDEVEEWQGIPVLLDDMPLTLSVGHPLRGLTYEQLLERADPDGVDGHGQVERTCTNDDVREDERVVNHWIDQKRNYEVYVLDRNGRRSAVKIPRSPDRSMDRLTLWLQTMGAADAWDLAAEHRARETLREMLSERQWRQYDLTGSFVESSPRSKLMYLFRRLRPTVALTPRGRNPDNESMFCLAVLCMHPIGYYTGSWAGSMVPTDDVIAHLTYMRGDEVGFWKVATQHRPASPEAGL